MNFLRDYTQDELADLRDEFREPRRFRCTDGLCGQLDCARCRGEEVARFIAESEEEDP